MIQAHDRLCSLSQRKSNLCDCRVSAGRQASRLCACGTDYESECFTCNKPPKVSHIDTLRKFIYRLDTDLPQADRDRLQSVIATYQRLYVK